MYIYVCIHMYIYIYIYYKWSRIVTMMVNLASLMCHIDWWPSGRVLASAFCGCWFDLQ